MKMRQLIQEQVKFAAVEKIMKGQTFTFNAKYALSRYQITYKVLDINKRFEFRLEILEMTELFEGTKTDMLQYFKENGIVRGEIRIYNGIIGGHLREKIKSYFSLDLTYVDVTITNWLKSIN
jgi:hypothetical protein